MVQYKMQRLEIVKCLEEMEERRTESRQEEYIEARNKYIEIITERRNYEGEISVLMNPNCSSDILMGRLRRKEDQD